MPESEVGWPKTHEWPKFKEAFGNDENFQKKGVKKMCDAFTATYRTFKFNKINEGGRHVIELLRKQGTTKPPAQRSAGEATLQLYTDIIPVTGRQLFDKEHRPAVKIKVAKEREEKGTPHSQMLGMISHQLKALWDAADKEQWDDKAQALNHDTSNVHTNQDALQVMFEASFPRLLGYGPNCVGDAALSLHYGFWNKDGELETGRIYANTNVEADWLSSDVEQSWYAHCAESIPSTHVQQRVHRETSTGYLKFPDIDLNKELPKNVAFHVHDFMTKEWASCRTEPFSWTVLQQAPETFLASKHGQLLPFINSWPSNVSAYGIAEYLQKSQVHPLFNSFVPPPETPKKHTSKAKGRSTDATEFGNGDHSSPLTDVSWQNSPKSPTKRSAKGGDTGMGFSLLDNIDRPPQELDEDVDQTSRREESEEANLNIPGEGAGEDVPNEDVDTEEASGPVATKKRKGRTAKLPAKKSVQTTDTDTGDVPDEDSEEAPSTTKKKGRPAKLPAEKRATAKVAKKPTGPGKKRKQRDEDEDEGERKSKRGRVRTSNANTSGSTGGTDKPLSQKGWYFEPVDVEKEASPPRARTRRATASLRVKKP